MVNHRYAIVIPRYDPRHKLDIPFLMGDRVYGELPEESKENFDKIYVDERLFTDGSRVFRIDESVRGKDVYVINQPALNPDQDLMTSIFIIDALRRSDAEEIIVLETYMPHLRQDRASGREPITSRLVGDFYCAAGVNRVMTFHPHVEQAVMAFGSSCPLEAFPTYKYLAKFYRELYDLDNTAVCAPDLGSVKMTKRFANVLGLPLVIINKERTDVDRTNPIELIGNVNGKRVVTFDDVIDTGGSSLNARKFLMDYGAVDVVLCATHLQFNDNSKGTNKRPEVVRDGVHVIGTDSNPKRWSEAEQQFFHIYSLAPLIANIISLRAHGKSISHFFNT